MLLEHACIPVSSEHTSVHLFVQDQVQTFYEVSKRDVEEHMSKIRNCEAEMEKMQQTHQNEIRVSDRLQA